MREPNNRGYRQQRLGADPQTGVRSRLPRKRAPSGTGRRALDRAVWPLHTPRVFRNTRPVPGYRQETRDRQIAGWKLYTEDKGGDRDDWSSVTALYSANGFSTLFFFLSVENWNYWKLIIAWFSWEVSDGRKEFRFESGIRGEKNLEEFFV